MINQCILVGKAIAVRNGQKETKVTLHIEDTRGTSEEIQVSIPKTMGKAVDHLKTGKTIGIKGRLTNATVDLQVIAEKITFISMKSRG